MFAFVVSLAVFYYSNVGPPKNVRKLLRFVCMNKLSVVSFKVARTPRSTTDYIEFRTIEAALYIAVRIITANAACLENEIPRS